MAAPKRSKIQQLRDRATIAELYLKGWSQVRIGEFLELNQSNVSRELKKIKAGWKAETFRDYDLHVEEELHRLAMVQSEYWEGWQRSQVVKEQTMQERMNEAVESSNKNKIQRRTETRVGDPRFLEGILKCVQERGKLLDLYPSHSDHSETISSNAPGLSADAVQLIRSQILGVAVDAG